jgi:hypothetical protein
MNAHLKMLLNVSGIANRNDSLSLVRTGEGNNNMLISHPVLPLNRALRPTEIRTRCQKICTGFDCMSFASLSIPFDDVARIQSP